MSTVDSIQYSGKKNILIKLAIKACFDELDAFQELMHLLEIEVYQ